MVSFFAFFSQELVNHLMSETVYVCLTTVTSTYRSV